MTALSTITLCATSATRRKSARPNNRALRHQRMTGRSGAASDTSTAGMSARPASEPVISICSQQICCRWPKGVQHWAKTRAESRSPRRRAQRSRGWMLRHQRGQGLAHSSVVSSHRRQTTRVMCRRAAHPVSFAALLAEEPTVTGCFRIFPAKWSRPHYGFLQCARAAPASHRRPSDPRCPPHSWGTHLASHARHPGSAPRLPSSLPPCPGAYRAWRRQRSRRAAGSHRRKASVRRSSMP